MFNQLIESEPEGADFKNRRSYFMVSSLVVGVLFLTAVVISIYAADISLGNNSFELVEMVAPPDLAPSEPETAKPQPNNTSRSESSLPTRTDNVSRTDDPSVVPITTSSTKSPYVSRPLGDFRIADTNTDGTGPVGRNIDGPPTGSGTGISKPIDTAEVAKDTEPPEIKPPAPKRIKSGGVVNGNAKYLPKPTMSAAAISLRLSGKVDVQVLINEAGKVISANAVSGHPILRALAESAAWKATFNPTLLTGVPVKVNGVIAYNFNQ